MKYKIYQLSETTMGEINLGLNRYFINESSINEEGGYDSEQQCIDRINAVGESEIQYTILPIIVK